MNQICVKRQVVTEKLVYHAKKFAYTSDEPFKYDVQKRVPCVEKAAKLLGFRAETSLDQILDEVIPWIEEQIRLGGI